MFEIEETARIAKSIEKVWAFIDDEANNPGGFFRIAEPLLERFARRVFPDGELPSPRRHLVSVVSDTMQPAHASLWLREVGR